MINIHVTLAYHGDKGLIPQGVYAPHDSRLMGLTEYLLNAGHAKRTDAPVNVVEVTPIPENHELQLKIHAGRVAIKDGEIVTTRLEPLEIGIDPAIPGEDKTIETPAKKKRR